MVWPDRPATCMSCARPRKEVSSGARWPTRRGTGFATSSDAGPLAGDRGDRSASGRSLVGPVVSRSRDEVRTPVGSWADRPGRAVGRPTPHRSQGGIVRGDDQPSRCPPRGVWFGLILTAGLAGVLPAQEAPEPNAAPRTADPLV